MTKMTKRIGAAMLSTALLLGALTGCGGNTSSSTDGDNAASTSDRESAHHRCSENLGFRVLGPM